MLGAVSPDSFDTLHSYSNTFQMPFVTPWFPEKVLTPSSGLLDFAISMRPDYHRAIIDTVRYYGWKKIIYLYDSHDGIFVTICAMKYARKKYIRLDGDLTQESTDDIED
ncbi:unnamed protein product [Xylocopa violacea]|uniref:Receptor ligand binding region domain-containing protein n=1 Tax=Xylocopa violacea TaxID=135666 RepID=A0ABP1N329_XYLVO